VLRLHDARRPANGAVETEPRALACQGIAIAALHVRDRGGVAARHVADDLPHAGGAEGVVVGAHDLAVVVDGVVANRALKLWLALGRGRCLLRDVVTGFSRVVVVVVVSDADLLRRRQFRAAFAPRLALARGGGGLL